MHNSLKIFFSCFSVILIGFSCGDGAGEEDGFTPKPKGYNHIPLPSHEYVVLDGHNPYTFEFSKNALAIDDTSLWKEKKENYKIIKYPLWNAKIHLTYKPINDNIDTLNSLIDESYRLAFGHDKKAYGIEDKIIVTKSGIQAMVFELEGEVPSQFQFFTHDSTNHFLRGALYFDQANRNDSLAPIIEYVKEDMTHLINTLEWKE